jgi:hypothetical protein
VKKLSFGDEREFIDSDHEPGAGGRSFNRASRARHPAAHSPPHFPTVSNRKKGKICVILLTFWKKFQGFSHADFVAQ